VRVKGVGVGEGVRGDLELVPAEPPGDPPAERLLEPGQRQHDDGVHVLGVELRVGQQGMVGGLLERVGEPAVPGRHVLQRLEQHSGGRVVVDHLDAAPPRPGLEVLGGHLDRGGEDAPPDPDGRVLGDDPELPRSDGRPLGHDRPPV
jgi:hypothetical protein